jgi:hypothetical protein
VKVKEEMDSLKRALQDASRERDKAVQDLARLKQHLLDKVTIYWYLYFSCIFFVVLVRQGKVLCGPLLYLYYLRTSYLQHLYV